MKKRSLKLLQLNKQSISNLQKEELKGGNTIYTIMTGCSLQFVVSVEVCPDPDPDPVEPVDPVEGPDIPDSGPSCMVGCQK